MSLEKLDYILAVAEEQTLSRAAKRLYISQPTLTNYINKLERELGVKLFDRSVTPVQMTKAGAIYIARMKKIQQEANTLSVELRRMGRKETVFTVGIGFARGSQWLPVILPEFSERYPNVTLELVEKGEDYLENGVLKGQIDLAFGVLNSSYPELSYEPMMEETVLLAVPRSFACVKDLGDGEATPENPYLITGEQLGDIPFLMSHPGSGFYRCANQLMEQAGIHPGRVCSYGNMMTAYQLCGAGMGALFVTPKVFDEQFPKCRDNLAFCTLVNPPLKRRSVAGFRPENPNIELIRTMISITRETLLPSIQIP